MKVSEYIKKLNLAVVVKHGMIVDDGGEEYIAKRQQLLEQYIGTVRGENAMLGIRPVHLVVEHNLNVWFEPRIIRETSVGTYNAIGVQHATDVELDLYTDVLKKVNALLADDADIDVVFSAFGFVPYMARG